MKIGVISDTHDNLPNTKAALKVLKAEGVTTILHSGDVCGPDTIRALAGFDVWVAQGNMDRSQGLAQAVEETLGRGRLAWLHRLTLDGHALALIHGDNEEMLEHLIASDGCAAIFHGHTHRRRDRTMGRTRVVNPGSLGGVRGIRYSFCIFDLATRETRFVEVR